MKRSPTLNLSRLIGVISLPVALIRAMASRGVFDHGRHVMRIGVNDGVGIARDRDMAFPENQVAALQFARFRQPQILPSPSCCMSLSRGQPMPAAFSDDLDQAGAIDAEAALAAPQIGRADEAFGDCDKIVVETIEGADMLPRQIPALAR